MMSFIVIGLSYNKKYGTKFSYYSVVLLITRNLIRLVDIDQTKQVWNDFKWTSFVLLKTNVIYFFLGTMSFLYANYRINIVVMPILFILTIFVETYAINKSKEFKKNMKYSLS